MGKIEWNREKGDKLRRQRGMSFEEVLACIEGKRILAVIENPNKKYKGQEIFVIRYRDYLYYVPFVRRKEDIFLKTIIPSRKLTKQYKERGGN